MNKTINIAIMATGKYFPLGLRLVHRLNHFYSGNSRLLFHVFADKNPNDFIDDTNIVYHNMDALDWTNTMMKKFWVCLELLKEPGEYFVYIDADSNVHKQFYDEEIIDDLFITQHKVNSSFNNHVHYETNQLSSAYINPSEYPENYYQACYMGGNKTEFYKLIKHSEDLYNIDKNAGILARAEDESYIQKYFLISPPTKTFKQDDSFPIVMDDKGGNFGWGKYVEVFSEHETDNILKSIYEIKGSGRLWDIINKTVTFN